MIARWAKLFETGMERTSSLSVWQGAFPMNLKSPYTALHMSAAAHWPGAAASSSERAAYVYGAPCMRQSRRERRPSSPMQNAMSPPSDNAPIFSFPETFSSRHQSYRAITFSTSASECAVVTILTMSAPWYTHFSTIAFSASSESVPSKSWYDLMNMVPFSCAA